jgi:hypothetical protein
MNVSNFISLDFLALCRVEPTETHDLSGPQVEKERELRKILSTSLNEIFTFIISISSGDLPTKSASDTLTDEILDFDDVDGYGDRERSLLS